MTNIRWPLAHSRGFKFNDVCDEVIENKTLKTDAIYTVVILNSNDIKNRAQFIQDDVSNLTLNKLFKKRTFKKKFLETEMNETIEIEKLKIHWEMFAQNEMKENLSHKEIKRKKKSIVAMYKAISDAMLKEYIKGGGYFKNDKYSIDADGYLERNAFPYCDHQSVNEFLLRDLFHVHEDFLMVSQRDGNKWQLNEIKEKIYFLISNLTEIEEKKESAIINHQYISKATMSGYLRDVHYLSVDSVTKPFVSLVEEKKYMNHEVVGYAATPKMGREEKHRGGFLEKMNDQASSIEIFNLDDPKCVERFLKIFDID